MKQILFIMPFGDRTFPGKRKFSTIKIDFDEKYHEIKRKILELNLGFGVNRVDNLAGTDIYKKMYKSIHSADIVIADLTSLNPNVMYELGARHALRDKKTILFRQNEELDNNIPFDIQTFRIWKLDDLLENFEKIIIDEESDSPIKKEIAKKYLDDKKVFENYSNTWDTFESEYKECSSLDHLAKNKVIDKFTQKFEGIEEFDQKRALNIYKLSESESSTPRLKSLKKSLEIIEKYKPNYSSNHETVGLACTISRKIFEITSVEEDRLKSYNYSRHFISLYKTPYSFSSYLLNLMATIEYEAAKQNNNEIDEYKKIYYIEEIKMISLDWKNNCDSSFEPQYFNHTKNLIDALMGKETNDYNIDESSFEWKTSKETYDRALKLWYDYLTLK